MRNRMSVLSRRLERFAVGFSIATFAFLLLSFFAASNTQGQLVFLCAGLASACLFASFFLWLARGFAWAMVPEEPVVARKPAEALKLSEAIRPEEPMKLSEVMKPAETMKPAERTRPAESMKLSEPVETMKPIEMTRPAEPKAAKEKKPEEEKVIESEDPPDAKYSITGKRIY